MRRIKNIGTTIVAIALCLIMVSQTILATGSESKTLYVKDLKMIYADSEEAAKEQLPEGYILAPGNLNDDTGKIGVYLCYTTTQDPEEAITDIKVMYESGGFERTDFKSSLNEAIDGVYGLAQEMLTAVNEFAQNYKDKVPSALYAKQALDYFQYDENTLLGDFMVSGKGTYKEYGQMILMCHEEILNSILSLLALGVQKKQGENWIDKLADIDPSAYNESHDMAYRERASKLRPILQQFNDIYCYVVGYYDETYTYNDLTEENDKELFAQMSENKDIFKVLQSILQSYPVGVESEWGEWGLTAEDLFAIGLNNPLNIHESYALLDCLTPGQEIMLRMTGPYNFIIGSQNSEEVLEEATDRITEELDSDDKVLIWDGVNLDMFHEEVGLTSEAVRSIAAGKQYDIFTKDIDTLKQYSRNVASIVASAFSIATSAVMVTKCALTLSSWAFAKAGWASAAATISAFTSTTLVSTLLLSLGITFMVAGVVCAIFVTFFLESFLNWLYKEEYKRTSIPAYMVDETLTKEGTSTYNYYKRVDNVKTGEELGLDTDDNESGSDINANKGYRWMAIYTCNKSSVGNPIEADFKLVKDSGVEQEGLVSLKHFGKTEAVNLNSYADEQSSKYTPLYLFYKQDAVTPVESEKTYISGIRVVTASHEDVAKKELTNSGYIVLEHDFGSVPGESTFVGYKLTCNPNDAVRDIRLLYNFEGTGITYGQLNYGSMGKIGNFDIMVSSSSANPAPPVVSLAVFKRGEEPDAALGYEPVNEFSGGMAQPLGRSDYRLYFLPETTFTEGADYIAGIKSDVYYYNTYTEEFGYSYNKRYFFRDDKYGNDVGTYRKYKLDNYGEKFFDFALSSHYYFHAREAADSHNYYILGYKYTTTKNPYRALYSVSATTLSGLDSFNDCVNYGGVGHVLSAVEFSTNSSCYSNRGYIYAQGNNKEEFGDTVKRSHSDYTEPLTYYTSNNSRGKADAEFNNKSYHQWEGVHCRTNIVNQDITQVFISENMNALYLAGYQSDRTPLSESDIIITQELLRKEDIPKNFTAVCSMMGDSSEPINVAPSNDQIKVGEVDKWGGFSSDDVMIQPYIEKVYMYFRNEKTVKGKTVAQESLKEGKYISGVFLASREEIRESSLKNNKDLKCENIDKSLVENALLGEGATITYHSHINTNYDKDDGFDNANYTYVGITRTNDKNSAIRDIRLYIAQKGEAPKKMIKRSIQYKDMTFDVTYTLVSKASLTEQGNKSDQNCAKERQVYVYVSTHPALGEPITDIRMSQWFDYEDYEPVLTMDDKHFITAYMENKKAKGASIFIDDDYFMHGNHLSFRREGGEKPYIQSMKVVAHDDGSEEAIEKLLKAGYTDIIDKELNEDAGGDYIYIGMKRTADKADAVYDILLTNNKKKPANKVNGYTLVSSTDLNKDAGGKYIYLYEKRTPKAVGQSPLYDLWAKGKNYKNVEYTEGSITRYEVLATNQDDEKQDLNQKAGGDYIYLVKVFDIDSTITGSILGTGSIVVILGFIAIAMGVGGTIFYKKKRENKEENIPVHKGEQS